MGTSVIHSVRGRPLLRDAPAAAVSLEACLLRCSWTPRRPHSRSPAARSQKAPSEVAGSPMSTTSGTQSLYHLSLDGWSCESPHLELMWTASAKVLDDVTADLDEYGWVNLNKNVRG